MDDIVRFHFFDFSPIKDNKEDQRFYDLCVKIAGVGFYEPLDDIYEDGVFVGEAIRVAVWATDKEWDLIVRSWNVYLEGTNEV